jgi:hypothetical protein
LCFLCCSVSRFMLYLLLCSVFFMVFNALIFASFVIGLLLEETAAFF